MKRLLFDTHAFLWWLEGNEARLQAEVVSEILNTDNVIFVSVVNAWEIATKISTGKLRMNHSVPELVAHYNFTILPVLITHVDAIQELPLHHRDPFDRMLVAQAQVEGLTLITDDRDIRKYNVEVLPA